MATRIRVLRLLEYSYDSVETMANDMARWQMQYSTPSNHIRFRSVVLPPDVMDAKESQVAPLPTDEA